MSDIQNPYAPPSSIGIASFTPSAVGAYRDNDLLVVTKDFISPNLCILSGAEIPDYQKLKNQLLTYINPWAFILIILGFRFLLGLLPIIIVLAVLQKKLKIQVFYDKGLNRKKQIRSGIACASLIFSLVCMLFAIIQSIDYLYFGTAVLMLIAIVFAFLSARLPAIRVKKVKKKHFFVKNVHPDFLNHFPPIPPDLFAKK